LTDNAQPEYNDLLTRAAATRPATGGTLMNPSRHAVFRRALVPLLLLLSVVAARAQGEIGPTAVWQPDDTFGADVMACSPADGCTLSRVMAAHGASAEAVAFTQTREESYYLSAFTELGRVDLGLITMPNTAGGISLYEMLNGSPSPVSAEDLDMDEMRALPAYAALWARHPDLVLWAQTIFDGMETRPDGGQRFLFSYPMLDGCRACPEIDKARAAFDFDAAGNFLGVTYLDPASMASIAVQPTISVRQPDQAAQFDNISLDESLILYIDSGDLTLEHIVGGAVVRLTSGGNVAGYDISPTRQTIFYHDNTDAAYLIALEFFSDGRLTVSPPAGPFPAPGRHVTWSPDGAKLAYEARNSQLLALTARGEPLPLPAGSLGLGGWSHDSRRLAYCNDGDQLGVVDQTGASQIIAEGVDCPPSHDTNMSWSPAAPRLAYAVGDSTEGFMDTYVYDFADGRAHSLSQTGELLGWSPSGNLLAVGVGRVGANFNAQSVAIFDPHGLRAQTLPGITTATAGSTGWLDRPTSIPIFGRHFVADDLSFTEAIGDAVFDASAAGSELLWGYNDGNTMAIMCGDPRYVDGPIFTASYPVLPAPGSPNSAATRPFPGVEAQMAPDGRTALVSAYAGINDMEGDWELHLLACRDGAPLLKQGGVGLNFSSYSAAGRLLLIPTPTGDGFVSQIFEMVDDGVVMRRTYTDRSTDFEWLVTPDAAPPVSQSGGSFASAAAADKAAPTTGEPAPTTGEPAPAVPRLRSPAGNAPTTAQWGSW